MKDLALVSRARGGDGEAFSTLVRRYHERIYNTVYALVGDADDADDLTQEAFIRAYRSLSGFRGRSQFYTWLYRISVNCCLDWMKSPSRRRSDLSLERDRWEGREDSRQAPPADTDQSVERRELQGILEAALDSLQEEYRATIVLREIDGLAYEEIAGILGCCVGTVKSRLVRARSRLREVLEKDYHAWFNET